MRIYSIGAVALLALGALSSGATAEPMAREPGQACSTAFQSNKARIEDLASRGNAGAIRSLLAAQGCPGASVNIVKSPMARAQLAKMTCTVKLIPPSIICTFGMAALPHAESN